MGTIRSSSSSAQGLEINGIVFGQPVENHGEFLWDDSMLPNGIIDEEGNITIDEIGVEE